MPYARHRKTIVSLLIALCSVACTQTSQQVSQKSLGQCGSRPPAKMLLPIVQIKHDSGLSSSGVIVAPNRILTVAHGLTETLKQPITAVNALHHQGHTPAKGDTHPQDQQGQTLSSGDTHSFPIAKRDTHSEVKPEGPLAAAQKPHNNATSTHPEVHVSIAGQARLATVLFFDQDTDLALLGAPTGEVAPLPLNHRKLREQQPLWAVGFPLGQERRTSIGLFQRQTDQGLYASAHINSGSSGGGLLSCQQGRYYLTGIIRGYLAHDDGHKLVNIGDSVSVPASTLVQFMENANGQHKIAQSM